MKDLLGMMSKVKEMQARMEQLQADLEATEVEGAAGGGMVTVRLTAKGTLKAIAIDPSLLNPDEAEILEDLIVAAHTEARSKGERLIQEKTQELTAGLPIPPGMKLF
ncbi:YbaB/EbfC family nucleoid-associated protein [Ancylobacter mangrovi]|uniref:Nucleoid-associated protein NVS89_09960 n=1 Tax=Ancylobacter mangrovi TaxID=2972472 RepID=A0A9X2PFV9_9HYPH|nr:YbaB/EbfC family nucleoid-associated protein [Ancylobacter mangrovi]MCS0495423.1 YbaB/EbfC family nucleoid-associated protein [Ancylobacter mangrovi]MCS0503069.1 YbaB/EbfC family nucleoid-associated protein [Ancylobacter mangrovi]